MTNINLAATIHGGARRAYNAQNPDGPDFNTWLGSAKIVDHVTGRNHIAEQLLHWCEETIDSERQRFSELEDEDQEAILTASRALSGLLELEELAWMHLPSMEPGPDSTVSEYAKQYDIASELEEKNLAALNEDDDRTDLDTVLAGIGAEEAASEK